MSDKMREAAERLAAIVLDQCCGYTSGPGYEAAQAARALREALAQPEQGEAVAFAMLGLDAGRTFVRGFINPWEGPNSRYTHKLYTTPPAPVVPRPIQRWPFVESPGEFAQRLRDAMVFFGHALPAIRNVVIENPPTLSRDYLWHLTVAAPEVPRG